MTSEPASGAPDGSFLFFGIGPNRYGLPTSQVPEVLLRGDMTEVPGSPDYIEGVMNYRGRIIPVVNGQSRLKLEVESAAGQLIILDADGFSAGLLVDRVLEIGAVKTEETDATPDVINDGTAGLFSGLARRDGNLVGLLDVAALVDFELDQQLHRELEVDRRQRRVRASTRDAADGRLFAVVRVGDEEYGLDAGLVFEVVGALATERPGRVPGYVSGLAPFRNQTIAVINMRKRLGARGTAAGAPGSVVIVESAGTLVGAEVDEIVEIVAFPESGMKPIPDLIRGENDHLANVAIDELSGRVIAVIDTDRLIKSEHLKRIDKLKEKAMPSEQEPAESSARAEADTELVVFSVNDTHFALRSEQVREILAAQQTTWVPYAPPYIDGVFQLRGEVIASVNIWKRLNLADSDLQDKTGKMLIIARDGEHYALHIEKLEEIRRIPSNQIEPPPGIVQGVEARFLSGIAATEDSTILLLDPSVLFDRTIDMQKEDSPGTGSARGDDDRGTPAN